MAVFVAFTAPRGTISEGSTWAEKKAALRQSAAILGLPAIIFIGIYGGFASVTEIGAIAVLYVMVVGLAYRRLGYKEVVTAGKRAVSATVMIAMFFTQSGVPQSLSAFIGDSGLSKFAIVTAVIVFYLILGMFLEAISMMLLTVPILFPIMIALGIDPLAFGIFVVLAVEVAQITPPVGINLFIVSGIGKIPFHAISKAIVPYVLLMVLMMYLVVYIPELSTWLPATMGYGK
jgi:C4-dicarboxylate transporter DctM subunit